MQCLGYGMMSEVDWSTLFESFYEKVRVKIFFRDPSRIPHERLFEMEKKPFLISLEVEDETKGQGSGDMDDGKDDQDDENDDEADDLDDVNLEGEQPEHNTSNTLVQNEKRPSLFKGNETVTKVENQWKET